MRRAGLCLVGVALAGPGCGPGGGGGLPTCPDGTLDCYNLDRQVDGLGSILAEEDTETVLSTDAKLCASADGKLYAGWIDARTNFADVWMAVSKDDGKSWTDPPIRVKRGAGDASGLAMTCAGDRVMFAWEDTRDSDTEYTNIYFNVTNDGGSTWLDDDVLLDIDDTDGRYISLAPQVVVRGPNVHVVWFDQINGPPNVYIASSLNGGRAFGAPVQVSGTEEDAGQYWSGNPVVAIDGQGLVHVVWEDTRFGAGGEGAATSGAQDIFHAVVDVNEATTVVSKQTRLTRGEAAGRTYGFAPSLATEGDEVFVVWHDTRAGDARDIFLNYSPDNGDTWLPAATRVESDAAGSFESLNTDVVMYQGVAHIVWQDNRNGGYDIYYRAVAASDLVEVPNGANTYHEIGDTSPEEVRVDTDGNGQGNSLNPIVRITPEGRLAVAWEDRRASGEGLNDIYYNFKDLTGSGGGSFARSDLRLDSVFAGTKYTESLNLSVRGDKVYALWVDNRDATQDADDRDIYFSSVEFGQGVDLYENLAGGG